ncbi:hypothetical protein [Vibrio sp.]|uniref:hypothetical protein n=1 Tax=Vibrio sp. TaxID=678 RepID=UPI003AA8EDAB
MARYTFGESEFTNILWIKNKDLFIKPDQVNVEFTNSGNVYFIVEDTNGNIVKEVKHDRGGWTSFHLPSLGLYDNYYLGFRNADSGTRIIKQGDVEYEL